MDPNSIFLNAASNGDGKAIDKALKSGAYPNIMDKDGNTPLHLAAERGHFLAVKKLLEAGADDTIKNKDSLTPRKLAEKKSRNARDTVDYQKVIEQFSRPPLVDKPHDKEETGIQKPLQEIDNQRKDICIHFQGHISQWYGGRFQDGEYSVQEIIYCEGLAESLDKLVVDLRVLENKIVREKRIVDDREKRMNNSSTGGQKVSNTEDEKDKKEQKNQSSEHTAQSRVQSIKLHGEPGIRKHAKRWIHLPANNVRSKISSQSVIFR